MGSQKKKRLIAKASCVRIAWTAAAAVFLLCGTLLSADINGTGNASAEAAAKAVDLSRSTASWADFLPLPSQMPPAQKITLAYTHALTDSSSDTIADPVTPTDGSPSKSSAQPRSTLKKQEIIHPTVYTTHKIAPVLKAENAVFHANLAYLTAVNVADYFSTRKALQYEELYEANPLMRPFVGNDLAFAVVKLGLTAGSVFFLKRLYKKNKTLGWAATIVANLAVSYVVVNNLRAIDTVQAQRGSIY